MKIALYAVFALLLLFQSEWELKKEKDGIKVFTAESEDTNIKKFKVEAYVNAKPMEIAAAIIDLENNYKWFVNVDKAELLQQFGKDDFVFKQVIQVPFPFRDREVVARCLIKKLPNGVIRLDLKEEPGFIPINDEYVRMEISRGYWMLSPSNQGTNVEYSFLSDPGGDIPAWIVNQFVVNTPFKTIRGLRDYLQK